MSDSAIFRDSIQTSNESSPMVEQQFIPVQDVNNLNYSSNQIILTTASQVSSGRFVDYSNSYLSVPLVMYLSSTDDSTGFAEYPNDAYAMVLKAGNHFFNSFQISLQGSQVTNTCTFASIPMYTKLLQMMSIEDLKCSIKNNLYPDSPAWNFEKTTGQQDPQGISNNRIFDPTRTYYKNTLWASDAVGTGAFPLDSITAGASYTGTMGMLLVSQSEQIAEFNNSGEEPANTGLYERSKEYSYDPTKTKYSQFLNSTDTKIVWKNYFERDTAKIHSYKILYNVYLRDLHDLFLQLPLLRSVKVDVTINVNQGRCTFTAQKVASTISTPAYVTMNLTSASFAYGICPFTITSGAVGQPNSKMVSADTSEHTFEAGIFIGSCAPSNNPNSTISHPSSSCQLWLSTYMLQPDAEEEYLRSSGGNKKVWFKDLMNFNTGVITKGATFSQLLQTGCIRPMTLYVYPFLATGNTDANYSFSPLVSPFSTEPSTCAPLFNLKSYQVLISGHTLYQNFINYTYQDYVWSWGINSLNGKTTYALSSGLINQTMWENCYSVFVSDLSRKLSGDDTPKSIQIQGSTVYEKNVVLYTFIEQLKSVTFELSTGILKGFE